MFKIAQFLSKDVEEDLINLLVKNPNPKDSVIHAWAEKNKKNVHKIEGEIYKLATIAAQFLAGGRAKEKNFTEKDANKKELALGIKVEAEHIANKEIAKRIALDHLAESNSYYTALAEMEKKLSINE